MRGPRGKIERAKKHFAELEAANKRFTERNPYELVPEVEGEYLIQRLVIHEETPIELPLIAGDAIHNMRSALDLTFCQLVEANGIPAAPSDVFPIHATRKKYESGGRGQVKARVSKDALDIIDTLKPYKGGNNALWALHKLDIVDKHRAILTAPGSIPQLLFQHSFPLDVIPASERDSHPFADISVPINVAPSERGPLKDGDSVFRCLTKDFENYKGTQVLIQVAIHEPGIVECEPLTPFMANLGGAAESMVELFASLLSE
jgi:hypothetical protein